MKMNSEHSGCGCCGLLRAPQGDDDFEAELESHVAMHTEDGMRAGLSAEEARRQALIRLGGVEQTRQAYRERRGLPWLESLVRDLAYACARLPNTRGDCRRRAFDRPGHRRQRHHLLHGQPVCSAPRAGGRPTTLLSVQHTRREVPLSWPLFTDLRDQAKSFSGVAALLRADARLDRWQRRTGARVGPGSQRKFLRCH